MAFTEPHEMLEALMESNRGRLQEKERQWSEMIIEPMKKSDQIQWRTFRQLKLLRAEKSGRAESRSKKRRESNGSRR